MGNCIDGHRGGTALLVKKIFTVIMALRSNCICSGEIAIAIRKGCRKKEGPG